MVPMAATRAVVWQSGRDRFVSQRVWLKVERLKIKKQNDGEDMANAAARRSQKRSQTLPIEDRNQEKKSISERREAPVV